MGALMVRRIGPLGRITPPRFRVIGSVLRRLIRQEDPQSRAYCTIFLRRVLRSIPRIWAARVLLPSVLARTLRI